MEGSKILKKTMILAVLALVLLATAPVSAQPGVGEGQKPASRTVTVTGVIEKPDATAYMYGTHSITDEATGTLYALGSDDEELLDRYTGRRATVIGTSAADYEGGAIEGGPPLIRVSRIEPAGAFGEEVTVEFALTISGEIPDNLSFYVESSTGPGGVICTTDADVIEQAGYPECRGGGEVNKFELAVPAGETFNYRILKSQGVELSQEVVSEGSEVATEGLVINAFYSRGVDLNGDGVVNEADGEVAAATSDAAIDAARSSGERTLPVTSGPALPLLLATFLLAAGFLTHRALRR